MPVCPKCDKESNNLRMCPFCHAEYLPPGTGRQSVAQRKTGATPFAGTATVSSTPAAAGRPNFGKKTTISPVTKFGLPVLVVVFCVWYFLFAGERRIPVGVVMPNLVNVPMSREQAEGLLKRTNESASVETRGGDLQVTFRAVIWPEQRAGQLALAQQYTRASELVEGKKRNINFLDPSGVLYAKASAVGVMMVK